MKSFEDVTIGQMVIYRSKSGDYVMPAVVVATQATLHRGNVEAGRIPDLYAPDNVHLVVYTAGTPGQRNPGTDPSLGVANPPAGGTFQEWDVPFSLDDKPGTWSWPKRS